MTTRKKQRKRRRDTEKESTELSLDTIDSRLVLLLIIDICYLIFRMLYLLETATPTI